MDHAAASNALFREFAEHRSETALANLVRDHLDLVYSVALRRCGGQTGLAEDICQAVFTDFARKARTLPADVVVAGWLYQHASFVAATTLRAEDRRRRRERIAMQLRSLADDTDWSRLAPLLDDALIELDPSDRDPVVLRYLEQRPLAEVGLRLGLSENTARMRVDRALDKLRAKLAKRGVTSTASALAAALAGPAVTAAPATLGATVTTAALAAAATTTSTVGILTLMASTKLKLSMAAILAAVTATAFLLQQRTADGLRAENVGLHTRVGQLSESAEAMRKTAARKAVELANIAEASAELARLRTEVARWRLLGGTQSPARNLTSFPSQTENISPESGEAWNEFVTPRINVAGLLAKGLILSADKNGGRPAGSLTAVVKELDASDKLDPFLSETLEKARHEHLFGHYEILYQGSFPEIDNPASAIIVREREAWRTATGLWMRVYAFANGNSVIVASPDGDFAAWEARHMVQPLNANPIGTSGQ